MLDKLKKIASNITKVFKTDGVYTQFNLNPNSIVNTYEHPVGTLARETLENIYRSNGIGKRIVDSLVEDAMRSFIDCDKDLLKELERIGTKSAIEKAGKFSRLFGGALLVMMVDDGQPLDKPLRLDRQNGISAIYKIHSLQVFDRHQVTFTQEDLNTDLFSPYFLMPEVYNIHIDGNAHQSLQTQQTNSIRIHRSRCQLFLGEQTTNRVKLNNQGWGESCLTKVYVALMNYLESQDCTVTVQRDFVQVVVKIKDLIDTISNEDGKAALNNRMSSLNILRSLGLKNMIVVDAEGEDYTKHSSSMSGFSEATDRIAEFLAACAGMPISRLFGRSPAGLSSTGAYEMQGWYDSVRSWRNDHAKSCIDWIIDIASAQQTWKNCPANLEWEFPSLTAPSEKEQAEIRRIYAEIDWGYADRGAIDLASAYQERFGTGKFHENIKIDILNNEQPLLDEDNADLAIDKEEQKLKEQAKQEEKTTKIVDALYAKVAN